MLGTRARRRFRSIRRGYRRIQELTGGPEERLAAKATQVSSWSVAEQLMHILLVNTAVLNQVRHIVDAEGEDDSSKGQPTRIGRVVLVLGRIPRGRGRAPDTVVPPASVGPDELAERLAMSLDELRDFESLCGREDVRRRLRHGRRRHFAFGDLTALQWLRFAAVHTWHHLRIVRDILHRREHL